MSDGEGGLLLDKTSPGSLVFHGLLRRSLLPELRAYVSNDFYGGVFLSCK